MEYSDDVPSEGPPFILDPVRLGVNFLGVGQSLLDARNVQVEEVNGVGMAIMDKIIGNRPLHFKATREDYMLYLDGVCRWYLEKRGFRVE